MGVRQQQTNDIGDRVTVGSEPDRIRAYMSGSFLGQTVAGQTLGGVGLGRGIQG